MSARGAPRIKAGWAMAQSQPCSIASASAKRFATWRELPKQNRQASSDTITACHFHHPPHRSVLIRYTASRLRASSRRYQRTTAGRNWLSVCQCVVLRTIRVWRRVSNFCAKHRGRAKKLRGSICLCCGRFVGLRMTKIADQCATVMQPVHATCRMQPKASDASHTLPSLTPVRRGP